MRSRSSAKRRLSGNSRRFKRAMGDRPCAITSPHEPQHRGRRGPSPLQRHIITSCESRGGTRSEERGGTVSGGESAAHGGVLPEAAGFAVEFGVMLRKPRDRIVKAHGAAE